MKRNIGLLICVVALGSLMGAIPATAAQSFLGHTGLINIPTTEVMSMGEFSLGGYFLNFDRGPDTAVYAATTGVFPKLEAGISAVKPDGGDTDWRINAKYNLIPETIATPAVSAGVFGLGGNSDTTGYVVVGKALEAPGVDSLAGVGAPHVYLGLATGGMDGLFGGISATLGDKLTLMVEHDTNDFNFGARFAITNQIRLHGAIMGGDNVGFGISFYAGL